MLQYKTTCIPATTFRGVKKREFYQGLSMDTGNKAIAPVGQAIQDEAVGGWALHSIECLPQQIARKKGIFELLLGWIPIVGRLLCPNIKECNEGVACSLYVLVFAREA